MDVLIIVVGNANKNTHVGALFQIQNLACVFNGLPGSLEQKSLLRIDVRCLARRNSEELRIKLIEPRDESPSSRNGLTGDPRFSIIEALHVPPVGRHI